MADTSMDAMSLVRQHLQAHPDAVRGMLQTMVEALMGAEVDTLCGAEYGERSPDRVNSRNGYRVREWDTRAGTVELAIPRLRQGSYYPDWLLEPRRRAERAMGLGSDAATDLSSSQSGPRQKVRGLSSASRPNRIQR